MITFAELVAGPQAPAASTGQPASVPRQRTQGCVAAVWPGLCGADAVRDHQGFAWYCPIHMWRTG